MMTRLAAVDLFVWHESLDGGSPGIDVLIRLLGDPIPTYLVLGGVFSSSCPACSKNTSKIY